MTVHVFVLRKPSDPTKAILNLARTFTDRKLQIKRDRHGKPYFSNFKKLHFNISHSGSKWTIAFSKAPVGIDIEKIKNRKYDGIVNRIGTVKEIEFFSKSKKKMQDFYVLWSRKEAISKCIGLGFKYGFEKIHISKWNVQTYRSGRFILSVASKKKAEKFKIASSSAFSTFQKIP